VRLRSEGLAAGLSAAIAEELRAELGRDGIALCTADADRPVLASITLGSKASARVDIEVEDSATGKRLARRHDLDGPDDTAALSVAVAADELLRASWAELLVARASGKGLGDAERAAVKKHVGDPLKTGSPEPEPGSPAAPPPPAAVRAGAPAEPPVPRERDAASLADRGAARPNEAGAQGVFALYSTGLVLFGAEVYYRRAIVRKLDVEIGALVLRGLSADAPHGTVESLTLRGAALLRFWPLAKGPFRAGAVLGGDMGYAMFNGRASPGSGAARFEGAVASVRAGVAAQVDAALLRVGLDVTGGAAVLGLDALDGATRATGMSGATLLAAASVGLPF
jgi:hypothetical protein